MRISRLINILEDIKKEKGNINVSLYLEGERLPLRTIDQISIEKGKKGERDKVLFEHWERK